MDDLRLLVARTYEAKIDRLLREKRFKVTIVGDIPVVCLPFRAYQAWLAYKNGALLEKRRANGIVSYDTLFPGYIHTLHPIDDYQGYQRYYPTNPWRRPSV